MKFSAPWQDSLALTNPQYRKAGQYTHYATGRAARRKMEKEERRIAKQENREAKR